MRCWVGSRENCVYSESTPPTTDTRVVLPPTGWHGLKTASFSPAIAGPGHCPAPSLSKVRIRPSNSSRCAPSLALLERPGADRCGERAGRRMAATVALSATNRYAGSAVIRPVRQYHSISFRSTMNSTAARSVAGSTGRAVTSRTSRRDSRTRQPAQKGSDRQELNNKRR